MSAANRTPGLGEVVSGPPLAAFEASVGALVASRAALDPARAAVRFRDGAGRWRDLSWGELDARRRAIAAASFRCE